MQSSKLILSISIAVLLLSLNIFSVFCIVSADAPINSGDPPVKIGRYIRLYPGWNLISSPVPVDYKGEMKIECPITNGSPGTGPMWSWDDAVYYRLIVNNIFGWNASSQLYYPSLDGSFILAGQGYWMYAYWDVYLWIYPPPASGNLIRHLGNKWNVVGYPFDTQMDKADVKVFYDGSEHTWAWAVSNHVIIDTLYNYDPQIQLYGITNYFTPGEGVWIYSYHEGVSLFTS
jgi:hypothetical protein